MTPQGDSWRVGKQSRHAIAPQEHTELVSLLFWSPGSTTFLLGVPQGLPAHSWQSGWGAIHSVAGDRRHQKANKPVATEWWGSWELPNFSIQETEPDLTRVGKRISLTEFTYDFFSKEKLEIYEQHLASPSEKLIC